MSDACPCVCGDCADPCHCAVTHDNVNDNRKLYMSVLSNSLQSIRSVSEQLVEFDNGRKDVDNEAGKRLHAALDGMMCPH